MFCEGLGRETSFISFKCYFAMEFELIRINLCSATGYVMSKTEQSLIHMTGIECVSENDMVDFFEIQE